MAPHNPVTNLTIGVWTADAKFGQVSFLRQHSSRHHNATPASHLRAGRIMRHLLRGMDPLMGMAPYSYGGPRVKPTPATDPDAEWIHPPDQTGPAPITIDEELGRR